MSFISSVNDWTSALLKIALILFFVLVVGYFGLSVYGNLTEKKSPIDAAPSLRKALYAFTIKNTGAVLLTKEYDSPAEGKYALHGFYALRDDKWFFFATDLKLDEHYYGDILITRRVR